MRSIWKCHIVSESLVKANLKFHCVRGLGADFHIWTHWPKTEKITDHKLRYYGLCGVLNMLLVFSYPSDTDFE